MLWASDLSRSAARLWEHGQSRMITRYRLGVALIVWGGLAWIPYFGFLLIGLDPWLPFPVHLAWHLSGVIPGTMLTGSSLLLHLYRRLRR